MLIDGSHGTLCFQADHSTTVANIKNEIADKIGIPPKYQLLRYKGRNVSLSSSMSVFYGGRVPEHYI